VFQNKSTKTDGQQAGTVRRSALNEKRQPITVQQNLVSIQQTLGNQAANGLLATALMQPKLMQPKLRIGPVGDAYEQQAERLADQVMEMKEAPVAENPPVIDDVPLAAMQRVCVTCEDEALRRQAIDEDEELLLQRQAQAIAASSGDDAAAGSGIEAQVGALRSGGQPLSPVLLSFYEPRFNHDFSAVRVHTDSRSAQVSQRVQARAFTVGRDVVFGAGEYQPASRNGRHLIAHELTHVIQQTPLVARRSPALQPSTVAEKLPGNTAEQAPTPADGPEQQALPNAAQTQTASDQTAAVPGLIVEQAAEVGAAEQMSKTDFLSELQRQICQSADVAMAGSEFTAQDCPWIDMYLRFYEGRSASRLESDLLRYASEAVGVRTAREYIPFIAARVQRSVAVWVKTGEITGVPDGIPTGLPGFGLVGRLLFKARAGGPSGSPNPVAVQAQLGPGQSLSSSIQSRMRPVFGQNISHVRVHTDATAAGLSTGYNARAFTVGHHVAFASGEFRPGTLMGDALLAHELAHVVQQGGAHSSASMHRNTSNVAVNGLERDADRSAVGALIGLWGNNTARSRLKSNGIVRPQRNAGLRLQRCAAIGRALFPIADRGWSREGILEILCSDPAGKTDIKVLKDYKVYSYEAYTYERQYFTDASKTTKKGRPALHTVGGYHNRKKREIGFDVGITNAKAASTLIHELTHAKQHIRFEEKRKKQPGAKPPTKAEKEYEAHIKQEEFNIRKGYPPKRANFRKMVSGKWVVNEPAIRKYVDKVYGIGPKKYYTDRMIDYKTNKKGPLGPWKCP